MKSITSLSALAISLSCSAVACSSGVDAPHGAPIGRASEAWLEWCTKQGGKSAPAKTSRRMYLDGQTRDLQSFICVGDHTQFSKATGYALGNQLYATDFEYDQGRPEGVGPQETAATSTAKGGRILIVTPSTLTVAEYRAKTASVTSYGVLVKGKVLTEEVAAWEFGGKAAGNPAKPGFPEMYTTGPKAVGPLSLGMGAKAFARLVTSELVDECADSADGPITAVKCSAKDGGDLNAIFVQDQLVVTSVHVSAAKESRLLGLAQLLYRAGSERSVKGLGARIVGYSAHQDIVLQDRSGPKDEYFAFWADRQASYFACGDDPSPRQSLLCDYLRIYLTLTAAPRSEYEVRQSFLPSELQGFRAGLAAPEVKERCAVLGFKPLDGNQLKCRHESGPFFSFLFDAGKLVQVTETPAKASDLQILLGRPDVPLTSQEGYDVGALASIMRERFGRGVFQVIPGTGVRVRDIAGNAALTVEINVPGGAGDSVTLDWQDQPLVSREVWEGQRAAMAQAAAKRSVLQASLTPTLQRTARWWAKTFRDACVGKPVKKLPPELEVARSDRQRVWGMCLRLAKLSRDGESALGSLDQDMCAVDDVEGKPRVRCKTALLYLREGDASLVLTQEPGQTPDQMHLLNLQEVASDVD